MITQRKNPSHPGAFIRRNLIEAENLNIGKVAEALGVSRPNFSKLLNEHCRLTAHMALRIEAVFGISAPTLLRMQEAYDLAEVRKKNPKISELKAFKEEERLLLVN